MDQVSKQTVTHDARLENNQAKRIVGVVFGMIEIILGLRLIFKLLGANPDNGFIKVIYNITHFFVGIFEGIFARITVSEANQAVFEPATLIAIILIALIAWLVFTLMTPRISNRVERTEYIQPANPDNQQNPDTNANI